MAKGFVVIFLLALGIACQARAAETVYRNENYGYCMKIPTGLVLRTNTPPSPNHGFLIVLGAGRDISVDASYDATLLGSADAAARDRAADDGVGGVAPRDMAPVGGLKAEGILARHGGRIVDLVVAYRAEGSDVGIIYTLTLETDAAHAREDEVVFLKALGGFALMAYP